MVLCFFLKVINLALAAEVVVVERRNRVIKRRDMIGRANMVLVGGWFVVVVGSL